MGFLETHAKGHWVRECTSYDPPSHPLTAVMDPPSPAHVNRGYKQAILELHVRRGCCVVGRLHSVVVCLFCVRLFIVCVACLCLFCLMLLLVVFYLRLV